MGNKISSQQNNNTKKNKIENDNTNIKSIKDKQISKKTSITDINKKQNQINEIEENPFFFQF
jgi:hypothetical protein